MSLLGSVLKIGAEVAGAAVGGPAGAAVAGKVFDVVDHAVEAHHDQPTPEHKQSWEGELASAANTVISNLGE